MKFFGIIQDSYIETKQSWEKNVDEPHVHIDVVGVPYATWPQPSVEELRIDVRDVSSDRKILAFKTGGSI